MTATQRIERLQQLLNTSPADEFLRHALALEHIKAGDDATAENLFQKILADNPAYVGSWYHLAKLLERNGRVEEALATYEKGMEIAKAEKEQHAFNELRSAYEELSF